jgi:hypothetical protein
MSITGIGFARAYNSGHLLHEKQNHSIVDRRKHCRDQYYLYFFEEPTTTGLIATNQQVIHIEDQSICKFTLVNLENVAVIINILLISLRNLVQQVLSSFWPTINRKKI